VGRKWFLIVTALGEGGTGLALVTAPVVVIRLLFGVTTVAAEAMVLGRIAGAALVAIALVCWAARKLAPSPVLAAVLVYDAAAAAVLGAAGADSGLVGIALWPAVAAHAGLGIWCLVLWTADVRTGSQS
jgi:hypothetical protein